MRIRELVAPANSIRYGVGNISAVHLDDLNLLIKVNLLNPPYILVCSSMYY